MGHVSIFNYKSKYDADQLMKQHWLAGYILIKSNYLTLIWLSDTFSVVVTVVIIILKPLRCDNIKM